MTAKRNGTDLPAVPTVPAGILPSDDLAGQKANKLIGPPPRFLAFKGLDTRAGSCNYYKSVGAVEDCDLAGNYEGTTLTFNEWRKTVQIDEFCDQTKNKSCFDLPYQASAVFVNKADLNLTRDHHSVANAQGQLAAYVCNHPGPAPDPKTDPTGLFPSPSAVDTAINSVLNTDIAHPQGRDLIACVAMDRVPITSVGAKPLPVRGNGGEIFTRFLIFGPNGDLLPSVNLDGNGEKFVPGVCVACHGGTNYFARADFFSSAPPSQPIFSVSEIGDLDPDLFSYFLPYDVDNFLFHSQRHLFTIEDQQEAIYWLNSNALQADRAIAQFKHNTDQENAFVNLFNGWYSGNHMFISRSDPLKAYVPKTSSNDSSFYLNVIAPSCRTCHIAMDNANFDTFDVRALTDLANLVCGQPTSGVPQGPLGRESSYVMPNSKVTFDRFWLSDRPSTIGQPAGTVDQPAFLSTKFPCPLP